MTYLAGIETPGSNISVFIATAKYVIVALHDLYWTDYNKLVKSDLH